MDTASDPSVKRARKRQSGAAHKQKAPAYPKINRPKGPLVWFHLANDAAMLASFALIERLRLDREDLNYLITTAHFTPSDLLADQFPKGCKHQVLPVENKSEIEGFLDQWQPDCCLWGEMMLKATILDSVASRKIPMFLIDADLPDEKQQKLRWFPRNARKLLERFEHIIAVNGRTAHNMKRLGVHNDRIEVLGRLEEAAPPLDYVPSDRDALAELLASRPIWLAVGITGKEEDRAISAHKQVLRRAHRLLLILQLENSARGAELAAELEQAEWQVALRSAGQEPEPDTQIFIVDQPNEMGLWYRLSPVTFFGGTLDKDDAVSHDPFQASVLGSAVLHGSHTRAYANSYARLHKVGAAIEVSGEKALSNEVEMLLSPDKAAEMARAAWEITTSGSEVSDKICALVFATLDARGK